MSKSKNNSESIETLLEALSKTVKSLETGDLSLEESLTQFEEGIRLTKECHQILEGADERIKKLTEIDDEI